MNWRYLDEQIRLFAACLTGELKLSPKVAAQLATNVAADVRFLSPEQKAEIRTASPVPLEDRLAERTFVLAGTKQVRRICQPFPIYSSYSNW